MLKFLVDWTFDKELVNKGTGRNIGLNLTVERFLKDGYYYMTTASIYDSKYTGGDGIERQTRYNGNYVVNILGGKEWEIKDKNLLGFNLKFTFMGPYWYHPVDEDATHIAGNIVYDEMKPFNERHSSLETITDLTIIYRINSLRISSIIALQVKNIFGSQYMGKRYNVNDQRIENDFFSSPVPFISYKLEF